MSRTREMQVSARALPLASFVERVVVVHLKEGLTSL